MIRVTKRDGTYAPWDTTKIRKVLQWANIQGRPTSTAAEIDDAVSKRHSHANMVTLDKVGEDAGGLLQFNGDYVDPALRVAEW